MRKERGKGKKNGAERISCIPDCNAELLAAFGWGSMEIGEK